LTADYQPVQAGFKADVSNPTADFSSWFMIELNDNYFVESIVATAFW